MKVAVEGEARSNHLPALDGLRFIAFLSVFIHHSDPNPALTFIQTNGWAGVDIFFAISAYLFFYLFDLEAQKFGSISIWRFFVRRLLRIYPLMAVYSIAMVIGFWPWINQGLALFRLGGLLSLTDNLVTAVKNYDGAIPFSNHLWTLSYEFQIYFVIPFAFVLMLKKGRTWFFKWMIAIEVVAFALRTFYLAVHHNYVPVWVLPFLRPESVFVGLVLALLPMRKLNPAIPLAGIVVALLALLVIPPQLDGTAPTTLLYPDVAILAGSLLWLTLNFAPASTFLGWGPIRWLGKVSFGLYVYHRFAMWLTALIVGTAQNWYLFAALSLGVTIGLAAVSYWVFERPFNTLKRHFERVPSRPV